MKRTLFIIIILALLGFLVWEGFNYFEERNNKHVLTLYGNVDVRQVDLGFRLAGLVTELMYEEGDYVKKGDLVATLNRTPYTSQKHQSEANVKAARVKFENAEKLLKRRFELIGIGGVSQEDIDDAQTTRDADWADLQAAEAAFAVAQENLSYTEIYAPTNGVILTRIREPGTVVNPADPVYTLSVSSPIWIRAFVSEPDLGKITYGMSAKVTTDTEGAPTYCGRVGFISPVAEFTPKTVQSTQLRTDLVYRLRIYIDHPDTFLKQGMPVTVIFDLTPESTETDLGSNENLSYLAFVNASILEKWSRLRSLNSRALAKLKLQFSSWFGQTQHEKREEL